MKEGTINKKSWHYRLASFYVYGRDLTSWEEPADFCSYLKKMASGFFILTLTMAVSSIAIVRPLGDLIAWAYVSYQYKMWLSIDETGILLVLLLGASVVAAFVGGLACGYFAFREKYPRDEYADSFASMLYLKFRDKVCFKINFED